MSGLPPDTIHLVRQKADLVEVVAEKVVLRKQGKNFVGLCPFHNDRKPSFQVSPSKQIYKCFSCGAGGDVLRFVSQMEHLSFAEAVRKLAQRYHVPLPEGSRQERQAYERQLSHQEKLLEILALAADFYQHALRSQVGAAARQYLYSRHLSEETLQKFQVGFAPPGWQSLYEYLVNQKRQPVKLLEDAGLLVARQQGSGHYDRFRHRIMLPIFDGQGRVIGFAGRALGDEHPKYLNSPETELFNKSQVVYGLNFAREAILKADQALVVEGYFDVMALHQAGIQQTVAAMGTALTPQQVKTLLRYTESKRLIFNFDADRAGLNAATRAIESIEEQARRGEVELRILTLPAGKDADEFLREHPVSEFQTLLNQAPLWLDWQIEQVLAGRDLSRASDFQQAHQAFVRLLAGLGGQWRSLYLHRVAELLSRGNGRLSRDLEEELRRGVRQYRWAKPEQPSPAKGSKLLQSESHLLQIFLHFCEYRREIREALLERELQFSFRPHRDLWQRILELVYAQPELETQEEPLLTALRTICAHDEQLNERLSHLLWLDENTRVALMRPRIVVRAAIANMELEIRQKRYRYWTQLWDQAFSEGNTALAAQYQASIQQEYQAIQSLQRDVQLSLEDMLETPLAEDWI
ncbi:DNA primase [Thermostichus vulcanus]|uniref:DNA primase n=1 Tax=Thermostichus vulcanus str. 'Rupite' TaxID=2813851 RepID=A0ABT0C9A0_THEVL|nr:DNA primase [Thermostichus vulcanus]MCJ2542357.1 DNA primase [Thermostichus vulcanus str. 'Rupite']